MPKIQKPYEFEFSPDIQRITNFPPFPEKVPHRN